MNNQQCYTSAPRHNSLLASLPDVDWHRWERELQPVTMPSGMVVSASSTKPEYAYFPTTSTISLLHMEESGGLSEIATVGNEGVVGISIFMSGMSSIGHAVVQAAGEGYRVRAQAMQIEVARSPAVLTMLLRYTQDVIAQVVQTAACARYHTTEQQLARRLLMCVDRQASGEVMMTHEFLATLMGLRRETVTSAALKFRAAGIIRYSRGQIDILDRVRLQQRACECYVGTSV